MKIPRIPLRILTAKQLKQKTDRAYEAGKRDQRAGTNRQIAALLHRNAILRLQIRKPGRN